MQPISILLLIISYFIALFILSYFVGRNEISNNDSFFKANKQSPWYLVAFGMIGSSLSGVTFISVPGKVEASQFAYFQIVLGYILGYLVIGTILLPLYYKLNLTTIYTYLKERFGNYSYKTGAWFFLISRTVGSNLRLLLVANVLQILVFDPLGIPFWVTVSATIFLIWLYTFKTGIKTIIWTDTLQTLFMLIAVGICIYVVSVDLGLNISNFSNYIAESKFSKIIFLDNVSSPRYFWKQFFAGAFIAIVMTGLDQDMMQKNLTCRSLKDAQKNMFWFTIVLTIVNFFFLIMGLLFTEYAIKNGIDAHGDNLFPILANNHLGIIVAFSFILGLIAAAYSSADSALTSLTTSFCVDILDIETKHTEREQVKIRKRVHFYFVIVSILVILFFKYGFSDKSIIDKVLKYAGFTYGPLLGLFAFGLFTKWRIKDKLSPFIAIAAVVVSLVLNSNSKTWFGFEFGFEILIVNGLLTFIGLILIRSQQN
ncbi:sodium:solute symporter [Flavobacterium sp.]|uniref:sodium:solute symporter n=1 Tax=Flavobacterium sp. TaxID=239 RepID=UPI0035294BB7